MNGREGGESVVPGEVRTLLEERDRVREWLGKLEELEEDATPAVYERVRDDYRGRLAEVSSRLTTHREEIEDSAREHRERAAGLEEERAAEAQALEESEIRFRVGEVPEERWMRGREEREGAIAELDERLGAARDGLERLEEILAEIAAAGEEVEGGLSGREAGAEEAGGAAAAPRREGAARAAPSSTGVTEGEPGPAGQAGAGTGRTPRGREAGEQTPAAEPMRAAAAPPEGDAAAGSPPEGSEPPGREEDFLDELEFLESLSLDQSDRFDAVSLALEEEEGKGGAEGAGR